jgi:DnaJ-class molecular chaperone
MTPGQFLYDTNDLHSKIKQIEANQPVLFKVNNIERCGHCNGTGLQSNNLELPCERCVGVGYVGFKELDEGTVCPDCNSTGKKLGYQNDVTDCKTCGGSGLLDWIDAIRLGIGIDKIW